MLKVDTNTTPSKPWSKVQALTSIIQLKSTNSNNKNDTHVPFVSHSNTGFHEQETQEQPKVDRLRIRIASWNMYGRLLDTDLEPFLTPRHPSTPSPASPTNPTLQPDSDKKLVEHNKQNGGSPFLDSSTAHPYHLLAIGTQECERDISESLFYPSKEAWEQRLCEHLGDQYKMVRCETLAALHLAVFVNKDFSAYVKNVHSADIKTGWANMIGNKGAVAVSLDFGSQSLLFINCHLRAHQTKVAERNENVHRILHELQIKGGKPVHGPSSSNALFHLPSLKKLTQPATSIKSTKSAKSIDNEEPSAKNKTPRNSKSLVTPKDNDSPGTINTAQQDNINVSNKSENGNTTNNDSANPTSDDTDPTAKNGNNTLGDAKKSTSSSKKSTATIPKAQNKKSNNDNRGKALPATSSSSASLTSSIPAEEQHSVMEQFDHVFIFGDTNYRINADRQFVLENIKKQDFKTLLKYDQLTLERQQNTTPLAAFNEHPINFIPTYKFDAIDAASSDSSSSTASSSTSLPILSTTTATVAKSGQQEDQVTTPTPLPPPSSPESSSPPATATETSSSSESFVITPKNSLYNNCSVSVRYDTSPKQRVPSWTDRILWHDRHHTHHQHDQPGDTMPQTNASPPDLTLRSVPITTTTTKTSMTATNQSQQLKPKKNLKWIAALKRKNKNDLLNGDIHDSPPVDKNTVCYHYDTVMDPRLIGVSDHLPVIGVFGVWFDEWENGASKRAKSIMSFKKKVPLWKKWLM